MAKNKSSSENEHLRGIIRKLEAQNRELKKELARAHATVIVKEEKKEKFYKVEVEKKCPTCKSELKEISLGGKTLVLCSNESCAYRQLIKN